MNINIYELEKRATQGKWMVGASMGIHVNDSKPYIAQFLNKRTDAEYQANAKLAAHKCNNFMRMLEKLKKLAIEEVCPSNPEEGYCRYCEDDVPHPLMKDTEAFIAEMEEVKT